MIIAVYLPLLAAALVGASGPLLRRLQLRPGPTAWALTVGAGLLGATSAWSLTLLAGTLITEFRRGSGHDPVDDMVAIAAAAMLAVGLFRLGRGAVRQHRTNRELRELCVAISPRAGAGDLVVLADPRPHALAVRGEGGRVLVSSGMLAVLDPAERRVLLAHERAHLNHAHHWHTSVVRAASALNPILFALPAVSGYLCERWADEAAAAAVGDRGLTARSLARAALASAGLAVPSAALGYLGGGVGDRVKALQQPEPATRLALPIVLPALPLLAAAAIAADWDATIDFLGWLTSFLHR
jgi:Zn-dependent protease with chaperone function